MYVYGITQCYLPPDTSEVNTPRLNPSQTGRYSIDLPWRDGRLSWPRSLATYRDGIPARRRSPNPITSRAQCRLTTLIEANTLTTTLRRRSQHLVNIGIVIAHHCSLLIAGMRFRVRVRVRVCVSACFFSHFIVLLLPLWWINVIIGHRQPRDPLNKSPWPRRHHRHSTASWHRVRNEAIGQEKHT